MSEKCVFIENLKKSYDNGNRRIIHGLDLSIQKGESVAIMGTSGSGKTTLLNVLSGLDKPDDDTGCYYLNGKGVQGFSNAIDSETLSHLQLWRNMGFVFQTPFMLENFDVRFNIQLSSFSRSKSIFSKKDQEDRLNELLLKTELKTEKEDNSRKYASELSGGQRQRVAIARAVFQNPSLILADEPTGSLDPKMGKQVAKILKDCSQGTYKRKHDPSALIVVTHDPSIAVEYDRVEILNGKCDGENLHGLTAVKRPKPKGEPLNEDDKEAWKREIGQLLGFNDGTDLIENNEYATSYC